MALKVFVTPGRDELAKFQGIAAAFPEIWTGRVLDVGCRSGHLRRALGGQPVRYYGLDLRPPAEIIGSVEGALPFGDGTFDVVVALDVLEHTDDIHGSLAEACRVARRHVVLTLPNAYEIRARWRFAGGRAPSGKYGLPAEPPADRHRWLFSLREARAFVRARAAQAHFALVAEGCLIGPHRSAGRRLVALLPNLLSPWYLALLRRDGG